MPLQQEGTRLQMCTVDIIACDGDDQVVAVLRGELDVAHAASVAARLAAVAASQREIIVDLAGLQFIDSSGVAALVRVRKHARLAGGDLLLAAPQQQVLRVLTITRLIDSFSVSADVDAAASRAMQSRSVAAQVTGQALMPAVP